MSGVTQWVRERKDVLIQRLQLPDGTRFPCVATYSYVLRHVDAEELTNVIYHFFTQQEAKKRAKKNQPQLYEDLQLFFEDPEADRSGWQSAKSCDKGHGRLEIREITTRTDLNSFFERDWQDMAQVFRLQRTVTRKGKTSQEVVSGLTSLPPKLADPARLLHLNRAHWQIENRLHWRRDVTLGEDHCQVRTGSAPQVLAALNHAVLSLADALHISNLAAQMRTFDAHPEQALALLLASNF